MALLFVILNLNLAGSGRWSHEHKKLFLSSTRRKMASSFCVPPYILLPIQKLLLIFAGNMFMDILQVSGRFISL